ncbi:MAG TPA: uridine kinase [Bacteroidales bacterium]|nr:MAG: Uridine kinase [Bacteroidetes bacterium ADurb.Bin037]HPV88243.1 uridine kinase [Bacteroidales bacterium]HPW78227.1 uridine kinase [Bacteroidales bacterium]HQB55829.1 uridine kinase [Bacteroidales bacterium]
MFVIGIAGGTGSGKTTVVNKILERLDQTQVTVIPQDSYYKDNSHLPLEKRQELNFDHPDSIDWTLMVEQIQRLKAGYSIEQPMYSYITCTRSKDTIHIEPTQIIIVEGILIFTDPSLRECLDMKIFVDADPDDRLSRVISRDIVERGRSVNKVLDRYEKTVKPMHLQFIEPTKRYADIIIPQGGHNTVAINMLISTIEQALHTR